MTPKATCKKCKKIYYGWALNHKKCYCTCGEILNWEYKNINQEVKVNG